MWARELLLVTELVNHDVLVDDGICAGVRSFESTRSSVNTKPAWAELPMKSAATQSFIKSSFHSGLVGTIEHSQEGLNLLTSKIPFNPSMDKRL